MIITFLAGSAAYAFLVYVCALPFVMWRESKTLAISWALLLLILGAGGVQSSFKGQQQTIQTVSEVK